MGPARSPSRTPRAPQGPRTDGDRGPPGGGRGGYYAQPPPHYGGRGGYDSYGPPRDSYGQGGYGQGGYGGERRLGGHLPPAAAALTWPCLRCCPFRWLRCPGPRLRCPGPRLWRACPWGLS